MCSRKLSPWKVNYKCRERNGDRIGSKMTSTYHCAVSVLEMTTRKVRLSKEIASQIITSCCRSIWLAIAIVRTIREHTLPRTSRDTSVVVLRTQLKTVLVTKVHMSSVSVLVDRAWYHSYRIRLCTDVREKRHNSRWEHKLLFLSHVPRVILDTFVHAHSG